MLEAVGLLSTDATLSNAASSVKKQARADGAGGAVGIPIEEEVPVQQLIQTDPRAACDILEKRAKKKLKTFPVKVALLSLSKFSSYF